MKNAKDIIIKKGTYHIDGTANTVYQEFDKAIRDLFTAEEAIAFFDSGLIKIEELTAYTGELLDALKNNKHHGGSNREIREVVFNDNQIGLLYSRRNSRNHAEIIYIIFQKELLALKKEIQKSI